MPTCLVCDTDVPGSNFLTEFSPKSLLHNGSVLLALNPRPPRPRPSPRRSAQ